MKHRGMFFLSILFCVFFCPLTGIHAAEFYGNAPTGLLQLEKKYPYYLYVPKEYSTDKKWPLAIVIGNTAQEPKVVVEEWQDWAKTNQVFLLVTSIFPKEGYLPVEVDRWIFRIKQEVAERYRIDSSQVLLIGVESGAQYSAYLGLKYPNEFSATALFRRAWPGPLEKLMRPSKEPIEQTPFYVAVDPNLEVFPAIEAKAAELEQKGYFVTFDPLKTDEDFSLHRDRMAKWFLQELQNRAPIPIKPRTGFKGTLREMWKNIFGK